MIRLLRAASASTRFCLALLGIFLLLGVTIHRDYGISSDEKISRTNGRVSAVHVGKKLGYDPVELAATFGRTRRLEGWKDKDYGALFEVGLVLTEVSLGITDSQKIYQLRHLLTFLSFTVGLCAFYLLARMTLERPGLALLGTLMLATTPKLFAHAFYNSKDIPFMTACILAALTLLRLLRKPSYARAALHGLTCALAISLRIAGTYLLVVTCAMVLIELCSARQRLRWVRLLGVFAISATVLTYALWPYLWDAPIENFKSAFSAMSQFRYKGEVLFQGAVIPATDLPWSYAPVWIAITVPPLYTALFLVGAFLAIKQLGSIRTFMRAGTSEREPALLFGLFLIPLAAVIALQSVLYGSWRQLFFIYPFLLLTALHAARWLLDDCMPRHRTAVRVSLGVLLGLSLLSTTAFLVRSHPHQSVYFNRLAGARPGERFEMDSYGAAYFHGLSFLLEHQPAGQLRVGVNRPVGKLNALMLTGADQARITFVPSAEADYFISNYRGRPASEVHRTGEASYANPLKLFEVDGSPILGVYGRDP